MKRVMMTWLILTLAGSFALAIEPLDPPPHGMTKQERDWLRRHLEADMGTMNTFPKEAYEKMHRMVAYATADEIDRLTDCYQLTRKIAAGELRQLTRAQIAQAAPPQANEEAKADRDELRKVYADLASARIPARTVGEYIDASLPGWRAQVAQYVPSSYDGDDRDVVSLDDDACAGYYVRYVHRAHPDLKKQDHRGRTSEGVPAGKGWNQNGPANRGTNPSAAGHHSAAAAAGPRGGNFQGNGFQGTSERSFGRGR